MADLSPKQRLGPLSVCAMLFLGLLTCGTLVGCGGDPYPPARASSADPATTAGASTDAAAVRKVPAADKGDDSSQSSAQSSTAVGAARHGETDAGSKADAAGPDRPPAKPAAEPAKPETADDPVLDQIFEQRTRRAGSLDGGAAWINTSKPLDLKQLRGKFVLLDFWCFCCINCMHIIPELKQLEHEWPNNLVVIGVHSAKFDAEQDSKNITDAVLRYEIEHPVVNDSQQAIWNRYEVQSWPTLVLIDPEGYVLFQNGGEVKAEALDRLMKRLVVFYRKKGLLDEKPLRFELARTRTTQTPLRFPGKIVADEKSGRLFISDSNHNRVVVTQLDGTLLDTIGAGTNGRADGDYATAQFNRPQGMGVSDDTLYVADTENHLLRKIDLKRKQLTTIAGTGRQAENGWPGWSPLEHLPFDTGAEAKSPERFVGPPRTTALSSPWDLAIHGKDLFIAMAGTHQIWKMPLDESEIGPYAGNSREDIVDGPLLPREPYARGFASFAQPSGLAAADKSLYVADSEASSIRAVPLASGEVSTVVGTADMAFSRLFTFGDVDGRAGSVRLQHPLGVAYHNGSLYVADTYNNKIKVIDPAQQSCKALAGSGRPGHDDSPLDPLAATFNEPTGLAYAAGKLYVADTNNHLIRTIDLEHNLQVATLQISGLAAPTAKSSTDSAPK
jgi:thiol-disulfide isomerase/thioredoxin